MTESVQSVDVSVVGKKTAVSKYGIGSDVSLKEASVVQLNVTRADVKDVVRHEDDLLVTLSNGQVVTVRGYFLKLDSLQNNLVLEDDLEGQWLLNVGQGSDSGSMPFGFSSIQSIDPLLSEPGPSDERTAVLGVWHAALAALTIGAMLHDGNDGGAEPPKYAKPTTPLVDLVNGVKPITGTTDPGSKVTVTMPDGTTASTTADANGHFSVPNPGLKDKDTIKVVATSPEGMDSDPVTVVVDALAPNAPVVDPVNATDPIVGHAEPGATVTVTLPNGKTISAQVDGNGNFHVANPGLSDGDKISVVAIDPAGNVSDKTDVIVDAQAPVLTITDDVPGIVGINGSVTFTFTFSEGVKGFDASKIQLEGGVAGAFVAVSASVYTLVVKPNLTVNGDVKVHVGAGAAHDAAGNPSMAADASQAVDPIAPPKSSLHDIVLIDDVGPVTGEIKSGDHTDDTKPTYSGKADTSDVALVQIYDKGKIIGNAVVQTDGSWSFEPKLPMAAGPHSFQAQPIDAAGNVGDLTDAITFDLEGPAPAAPAITGVYDDVGTITGNIQKGYPTDDTQPTIEGTATPGTIVKVWDGSVMVGSAEVDAQGHWTITTAALSDGEHKLTATATDGAGQVSPSTGEYLVLVDTIPPAKPDVPNAYGSEGVVVGPGSDSTTVDIATPALKGHGEAGAKASIYDNGVLVGSTTVGSDGAWTYVPAVGLAQGAHQVTVTLTDKAGNTSESSDKLNFVVDTNLQPLSISHAVDDVGPITEPVPNGGATDDTTPTLVGTAPAGVTVTVYEGNHVLGSVVADADGNWSVALAPQNEGGHAYVAKAHSAAGTELTAGFGLTIDLTAPATPSIDTIGDDVGSIQTHLVSGTTTDDTTPTIHGSGSAGDLINIYDHGNLVGSTEVGSDGQWHYTVNPPLTSEGEHVLTATSVDAVGNESAPSDGFVIVLDVTPPDLSKVVLTMDKVAGDDYVNIAESQGDVTLTGKLQNLPGDVANSKIVVIVGGTEYAATLSGDTWTANVPGSALVADGEGSKSLAVKATLSDAAGNEAQLQITHDYMVDTTPLPDDWQKVAATLWDDVDPIQGEITSGMSTNDSKPVYKGVAESSAGVAYVEILDGGKVIGRAEVQPDGSWSFEPDIALVKGNHSFEARPSDIAGNTGANTPVIAFTLEGAQPLPPAIEDVQDNVGPITGNIQKGVPTDDATPTLSGTAERGTVVKVFDMVNGAPVQVGQAAVNDAGQWTVEVSALADGPHHLVATATDAAGQESDPTGEYLVQVDTTAPAASQIPVAIDNVGDKTGQINSGDVTDDSLPEIKGTAEAGDKVQIYDNGTLIGSTTAGSNGEWTYTPANALKDGAHSITVVLADSAGNVSQPSEALTFGVDTHGLELVVQQVLDDRGSVTGPIANGGATDDTTPTFVGKATAGATVSILEGTTTIASVVADANGDWSIALPEQKEGLHAYTVSALSVAGNTATQPFTLTVDLTAPEAPTIGGVSDDVGSVQGPLTNGGVTDDTTPSLNGKGASGDTINIYDNGSLVGSTTVNANGEWSYTVNPAFTSEGKHELAATSVDTVGNESKASDPFVITLDVTPPDVSNVQLTVNSVTEDNVVNAAESQGNVTLSGSLNGVPPDVAKTTVDIVVNGTHYAGTVTGNAWSVIVPGSQLTADTDMQLEVVAQFTDAAGNSATKQQAQSYLVDTTPPNSDSLHDYALMDDVGEKQGEIFAGDVTDDSKPRYVGVADASDVAKVRLLDNGQEIGVATVGADGSWWVEPSSPLSAGPHNFQLQALDAAGNAGELTAVLNFSVTGAAPQAPSITGVYDDAGGNIQPNQPTNDATPTLKGTATLGTEVTIYEVSANGERVVVGSVVVDGQGHWSVSVDGLQDGTHNLIATATDGAGQESVATGMYPVNVDTVAPDKPDQVEALDSVGEKQGALINGDITDDAKPEFKGSGEVGALVIVRDGDEMVGSTTVDASGHWSLTPATGLAQGEHSISVTLTDKAGNTSQPSDVLSFGVGTEGVELLIDQVLDNVGRVTGPIADGGATDDTTPTFVGTATAGATVSILEGSTPVASVVADANGSWTVILPAQTEGMHTYTVNALSVAGNTATAQFTLTVDLTAPEVPTIGGVSDDVGRVQGPLTNGGVTDDTTPSLTGTGTAGETINVYDNGSYVGSTTVNANGQWAYTVNPAITNEGKHELTVTGVDVVGNESTASTPFVINLDVTPPDVSKVQLTVNSVTDDNVINATEQSTDITLSGSIVNVPADVQDTKISVNVGGTVYDAVVKGGTWSAVVPGAALVADPDHAVEITSTFSDAAGNTSQLVVDKAYDIKTTAPASSSIHDIVVTDDVGDIQGPIANGGITDDAKPTVNGMADYPEVVAVKVIDNGNEIGQATVSGDGSWSFEPADALAVGQHSLQFRPIDAAGNIGESTPVIGFELAGEAPQPPVIGGMDDEEDTGGDGSEQPTVSDPLVVESLAESDQIGLRANNIRENEMDSATERAQAVTTMVTNDTTPTLKGTAVAGTTVKLYDVGADGVKVLVGTTIASAQGSWSVTTTLLAESVHSFIATSTDSAGQISAPSVSFQLIVDITPPNKPAPVEVMDNAGDITGVVASGGVMDDSAPVFQGHGEAGEKVKVFDNGKQVGSAVVGADGQWSFQPSTPLTEGKHSITSTLTDKAGNTSAASDATSFTLDTTPPKVSDAKLAVDNVTDDNVINQAESKADVAITGTLTGVPSDSASTKVVVTVNGTDYQATLDGDKWSVKVPGSALVSDSDLTVDVKATFTDEAGNSATLDASKTYQTDLTAPVVTDAVLAVNNVTDDNVINQAESKADVAVTGTLTGVPSDSVNTKVVVTVDGVDYQATLDGTKWSANVPGSGLASDSDLTVEVKATFTDAAGNSATLDASKTYQTDLTPPAITNAALTVNNVTDDNVVNQVESQADVAITGAVTGVPSDSVNTKVVVTVDGTDYQATLDGTKWSANVPGSALLADSDLTVDVKATFTDEAGNAAKLDASKTYQTDATPPAIADASLTVNNVTDDNVVNQAESKTDIAITGTLAGVPADSVHTKVVVTVDGTEYQATLTGDTWSTKVPGAALVSDADSTLEVKASFADLAGNVSTIDVSKTYLTKAEPPSVSSLHDMTLYDDVGSIQGPILSGSITDDHKPTYSGKASYPEISVVQVLDNGVQIGETHVNSDGSWSFEPGTDLQEGRHILQARPVDFAGNVGAASDSITFFMAGDAPTSPTISGTDDEPSDDAASFQDVAATTVVAGASESLALDPSAPRAAIQTRAGVAATPDSSTALDSVMEVDSITDFGTVTVTEPTPLPEPVPLTASVPAPAPVTPPVQSSLPMVVTNDTTPTLKGTAIAGTFVKLYVQDNAGNWVLVGDTVASAAGKWSVSIVTELAEGTYHYMATSTDASGQVSAPSTEFILQVDITKPAQMDLPQVWDDVGSIVGAVADGGFTDDTRPTISGTGEVGAKVTVYDQGAVLGTAVVGSNGSWTLEPAVDLAEGAHAISTTQKDAAGNVSANSGTLHFTVDTIAPATTSSIYFIDNVGEQQGQFASGTATDDRTPLLTGKLSEALEPGSHVEVYEGGNRLGVAVVNGNDWTFALPEALTNGSNHTYVAKVVDAAGNADTAAQISLNVALSMGVNALDTDDGTPLISGAIGGELLAGEHVLVTVDGVTYSSATGAVAVDSQNGIWYVQIPDADKLNAGSHHVIAQLVDSSGNVVVQGNGSIGIEATTVGNAAANTDWATAPGDATNNTLVFGLNHDGLWTIDANRHAYSSTDMSSYTSSVLGNLPGQSKLRTVVSMTAGDFDRNGTTDVFGTENQYVGQYQIMWTNTGNGYAPQKLSDGYETIFWGAVIAYDKTGDGYLDLAYGDRYGNSVTYLANKGGTLTTDTNKWGNAGMTSCNQNSFGEVSGVDINGDGNVDIARHDLARGCYTLSVINNDGAGGLKPGQSIANVFYQNEFNSSTTASMTWADFNGDGYMDLYLASGATSQTGMIYYNNGTGLLSTTGVSVETSPLTRCAPLTPASGFLSVATDWNHDGRMDVVKFSTYGAQQNAKLYLNDGNGVWTSQTMSTTLSNVAGIAAMDYNWDGAKDLIVSQQNGKIVYIQNNEQVADGTALHLQIVDSEGVNVYYGNTVQLHDSSGKLVAAQIINPQSGYGVNDTSGLVSFYGLDASETYTATLVKAANGVSSSVTWGGLEATDATHAYALSATAATGGTSGTLTGTGYNDTFIAESGTHTFDGSGGWTVNSDTKNWSNTGGLDVVDFRDASSGVNVDLGSKAVQGNAQIKATLVDIEGVSGSDFDDKLTGSSGNDWIEGRGGNDSIVLTSGGKDTLEYRDLNASDATGGNGSDVVTGFKVGSWEALANTDRIDLSKLLQDYHPASGTGFAATYIDGVATINASDTISRYLKVNDTASGSEIQVDKHGDGVVYSTLVTLSGVHTDLATLLANHQISLI